MKHLLNNLSEQEKNSIREQHTEKLNVVTENFSRLINSKLGNVKPLVEQAGEKEFELVAGTDFNGKSNIPVKDVTKNPQNEIDIMIHVEKEGQSLWKGGKYKCGFDKFKLFDNQGKEFFVELTDNGKNKFSKYCGGSTNRRPSASFNPDMAE